MLKKILKTKKLRLILILIMVGFLAITSLYGMAKLFLRLYDTGTYTEYNPDKMVAYLEKRYDINFPENAGEIKAARSGSGWDGASNFLLKFTAKPSDVEEFLRTAAYFHLRLDLPKHDYRYDESYESVPEWWKEPIEKGQRWNMYVKDSFVENADVGSTIYVYIDTSNDKTYVVYLRGTYDNEFD